MENRAVTVLSSDSALFQWQELLFLALYDPCLFLGVIHHSLSSKTLLGWAWGGHLLQDYTHYQVYFLWRKMAANQIGVFWQ